jgi:hypothetical protein
MSKIFYEERSFTPEAMGVVENAESILQEYLRQGYRMSLRGLYYQFIRRDLFPGSRKFQIPGSDDYTANVQKNYKWLGDLVSNGRVAGLVDWEGLVDETRDTHGGDYGYRDPQHRIDTLPDGYSITHWDGQEHYVEVWVEKEALLDIVSRPARRWNVASLACKGNPSTSAVHEAAKRLRRFERAGRKTSIVYLGDHDPTGVDIDRDVQKRLAMFRSSARVDRIALNMDQITDDLPPSPVKVTDSRTNSYRDTYGTDDCWELDALEPAVLDNLVEQAILARLDMDLWNARERQEQRDLVELQALTANWTSLRAHMDREGMLDYTAADEADADAESDDQEEDDDDA